MSTQAIGVPTTEMQSGEQAAAARIRQLQTLIEQTQAGASGASTSPVASTAQASSTDFATALAAATSSPSTATSLETGGGAGGQYDATIEQAALRNGVDPAVLHGLIEQESGFDPNAQSSAGASGLTQLMPGTASSLGVANPLDPTESIEGGARYLGQLTREFSGNTTEALAAYNAGPGAVKQYGGVPPYAETQSYVSKVIGYAESYRAEHAATAGAAVGIA
jgi:soluble lytic murein transglycosylase-like protein